MRILDALFWSRRAVLMAALLPLFGAAAALAPMSAAPALAAEDPIGSVAAVRGEAFARPEEAGERRTLSQGDPIHLGEVLTTGSGARLHVTLSDGGTLKLGANAAFIVDQMALGEPLSGGTQAAMRLFGGPFQLSGNHTGGQVRTPLAVIGIRGTDFWGGYIEGEFGVLLNQGEIDVITALGRVTLDEPGEGTMLPGRGQPPSMTKIWMDDQVAFARASVALDGP